MSSDIWTPKWVHRTPQLGQVRRALRSLGLGGPTALPRKSMLFVFLDHSRAASGLV